MKIVLSIAVYLALIIVLGYVLAKTAPQERLNEDPGDDEF
jgi:hypothetical protein